MNTSKERFTPLSPINLQPYYEGCFDQQADVEQKLANSCTAQVSWAAQSLKERMQLCHAWVDALVAQKEAISQDLCHALGRPLHHCASEVKGLEERARFMIDIAPKALEPPEIQPKSGYQRSIRLEPKGVVLIIAPWNYPYLTSINALIPALVSGNTVLLKPALQTAKTAELYQQAALGASLPENVFQFGFMPNTLTQFCMQHPSIAHIVFTGSVATGAHIEAELAGYFKSRTLELGGKDAAYVRADADLSQAANTLLDGAFFNAGQSCCAIERIYVDRRVYKDFLSECASCVNLFTLGDPLEPTTYVGPMISKDAAQKVHVQVAQALKTGAQLLLAEQEGLRLEREQALGEQYYHPRVLFDVADTSSLMNDESFGPVVAIQSVDNDQEAIAKINSSSYGLTAAIFSKDAVRAEYLGQQLHVGTCFLNRCDYLDPALCWSGRKQSGLGSALSQLGYQAFVQPKSYHFKL